MARNKSRRRTQASSSSLAKSSEAKTSHADNGAATEPSATAITPKTSAPRATDITTAKNAAHVEARPRSVAKAPQSGAERVIRRMARILGSLQIAVILLSLFAVIVYVGIRIESSYDTKIAQELVYKAWWFNALLIFLAINIFFAAAKKWPFKKHQTGFVITHIGLITMVFGGVLNFYGGVDAQMQLIDSSDPLVRNQLAGFYGNIPQSSRNVLFSHLSEIRATKRFQNGDSKVYRGDFAGGVLPWKTPQGGSAAHSDIYISLLHLLQNPFGQGWSLPVGDGARLEVIDFIPLAQREDFVRAEGKAGFPAFKVQLNSPQFQFPLEGWVGADVQGRVFKFRGMGLPILVEIVGQNTPQELIDNEFLKPPSNKELKELGDKGSLAIVYNGKSHRISVAKNLDRMKEIGNTDLAVKIVQYLPRWPDGAADATPSQPALKFELYRDGKKLGTYQVLARINEVLLDTDGRRPMGQGEKGLPLFWYHAPDVRAGQDGVKGVLQFTLSRDGRLYYRSFSRQDDGFGLEKAGVADLENKEKTDIWGRMGWKFRILEFYRHAQAKATYRPVNIAPGKETFMDKQMYRSVIRCQLHVPGKEQPPPLWIEEQSGKTISAGGARYTIEYTYKMTDLGFDVMLDRAEQKVDPGTMKPASYSSWVRIFDRDHGVNGRREYITMNEPLEYDGYSFYQSELEVTKFTDAGGKPVTRSGFTVAYDPGIWPKYLGSIMLGLGIFIMFYMKAYFFKPMRRKKNIAPDAT